jgi:hypothetical protein
MRQRASLLAVILFVLMGFAATWRLQEGIDRQLGAAHQERDDLVLRSGKLLNALSLEYGVFMADVYWTRVVQYYGEKLGLEDENFELLSPLLDLTTTLDPQLVVAYSAGALFLAEPAPVGAARPDLAVELLGRGIRNNPDEWSLWKDLGFIYYWDLRDYSGASEAFLRGSKRPGAPEWMKVMAAKVAAEGRSRATSAFLWGEIFRTTTNPLLRKNAERQLKIIKAEEDCERLDEIVSRFAESFHRPPQSLRELVSSGFLPGIPIDPEGYAYVLGRDGKVKLNPKSPLAGKPAAPVAPS